MTETEAEEISFLGISILDEDTVHIICVAT